MITVTMEKVAEILPTLLGLTAHRWGLVRIEDNVEKQFSTTDFAPPVEVNHRVRTITITLIEKS